MTNGYVELEFDLPNALLSQIVTLLERMPPADLSSANLEGVPDESGVYALSSKSSGKMLYIGKTEGAKGLKNRLTRHARKLAGRRNIKPEDVLFRAIRVFVFNAMDLEALLIDHFGGDKKLPWNHSGFGSNDPGRERDTTKYKPESFDRLYPIDLDRAFVDMDLGTDPVPVSQVMSHLKRNLPYLLRFQRSNTGPTKPFHKDFVSSTVHLTSASLTTREVLEQCVRSLPANWHVTALPSHIICYRDDDRDYPEGTKIGAPPGPTPPPVP